MRPGLKTVTRLFLLGVLLIGLFVTYKTVRWKAYIWLPDYIVHAVAGDQRGADAPVHIMFLFVDHYEPGRGAKAVDKNREWLRTYTAMADGHRDSYGRRPQHTWFYPYEQKNGDVVNDLAGAVYAGYGEIEFHWHHGNDTNASFARKLGEALDWFNSYGAMVSIGPGNSRRFGFIHGNWALDNSGRVEHCGVSRELDILREAGCYADFTFPSFGSVSQPSKTNSIYYSYDTDDPKSYDTGEDVVVGESRADRLMIFEGPLAVAPCRQLFEYGDIASDYPASKSRVDSWIRAGICVKGRPEWIFVKIYTHGIQNQSTVLGKKTDMMFTYLEEKYSHGAFRLHYVTAREAFNIVRAAEKGLSGDPDFYRDYEIKEPVNRYLLCDVPIRIDSIGQDEMKFATAALEEGEFHFRVSPIEMVTGLLLSLHYRNGERGRLLSVKGKGVLTIHSKEPLQVIPTVPVKAENGTFVYEVRFD